MIGLGALTPGRLGRVRAGRAPGAPSRCSRLGLFKNQVFVSAGIVALFLGFAMFGTITFLPLYFQVVRGASPTGSGLDLLPLMAGLLITSIVGGQIVSRTGKYRVFPIVGTAIITVGLFLLSGLSPDTSTLEAVGFMFVTGFGIGLVMQVLVVAVQNAVGYEDLGVATSGNTLFRNIGSSVGTAVVGTIFATELASRLRSVLPPCLGVPTEHVALELGEPWPTSRPTSMPPTWLRSPAPWTRRSRWPGSCRSSPLSLRGSSRSSRCAPR